MIESKLTTAKTINNINKVNSKLKGYYDNYNLSSIKYEDILNSELENKMDLYNIKVTMNGVDITKSVCSIE